MGPVHFYPRWFTIISWKSPTHVCVAVQGLLVMYQKSVCYECRQKELCLQCVRKAFEHHLIRFHALFCNRDISNTCLENHVLYPRRKNWYDNNLGEIWLKIWRQACEDIGFTWERSGESFFTESGLWDSPILSSYWQKVAQEYGRILERVKKTFPRSLPNKSNIFASLTLNF